MSAVLRHARKYRPNWTIDFQAEGNKHVVGRGIAHNTLAYGDAYPHDWYDAEVQIVLYDTFPGWTDRPNTRVATALREIFDLDWDPDCGRYEINVSSTAARLADALLSPMIDHAVRNRGHRGRGLGRTLAAAEYGRKRVVAVHYEGDTAKCRKDLTHAQADAVCRQVERLGHSPLLIDWRKQSPLSSAYHSTGSCAEFRKWGGDAEINAALIAQCEAFVGIDSGPGKCSSATETPSLIVWTGHHPAAFHDPAPNTTHLVPTGYHDLPPVNGDLGVIKWFDTHHHTRHYDGDPVEEIRQWLKETLV